jgi:hypothetical protein
MGRDVRIDSEVPVSGSSSPEAASVSTAAEASVAPAEESRRTAPAIAKRRRADGRAISAFRAIGALTAREKEHLVREILQVRGLMPLLMKPRNGQRWTPEDKAELVVHLRRLSKLSPYLVIGVMPGGFLLLPLLAWWLDRRRNRSAARRSTET